MLLWGRAALFAALPPLPAPPKHRTRIFSFGGGTAAGIIPLLPEKQSFSANRAA